MKFTAPPEKDKRKNKLKIKYLEKVNKKKVTFVAFLSFPSS